MEWLRIPYNRREDYDIADADVMRYFHKSVTLICRIYNRNWLNFNFSIIGLSIAFSCCRCCCCGRRWRWKVKRMCLSEMYVAFSQHQMMALKSSSARCYSFVIRRRWRLEELCIASLRVKLLPNAPNVFPDVNIFLTAVPGNIVLY